MAAIVSTLVGIVIRRLRFVGEGAALFALGCATPYAKLDGVVPGGPAPVTLVHQGDSSAATVQRSVVKGDTLLTANGVAVLTLRAGYEVIVEPGTELSIENPSIFVKLGKLIVRTIRRTREALRLNTRFVSAGVEGTEFSFEVLPGDVVRLTVLQGSVVMSSRNGVWPLTTYRAGQVVTIRDGAPPGNPQQVDPEVTRATRARTATIEQATRYRTGQPWSRFTPLWKRPVFFVPAAILGAGIGAILVTQGGDSQGTVTIHIPF
jgi:ferric-dicitrate binding protein FerR (iron transport regulator)